MTESPPSSPSRRLQPGDTGPDFVLEDADGNRVTSMGFRGRNLVLYFYPAASTPGCTTQACDFRDNLQDFEDADFAVVGVSPDPPQALRRFRDEQGLTFPLLSDPSRRVLMAYGAWGEKKLYGKTTVGVIRSTFVLDGRGVVRAAHYNVRATGHVAKLRRELGMAS